MSSCFDVAVVGAGPAGAAAALTAARLGRSVALFEPQPSGADKPCGEGILPSGVAALRELGLAHVLDVGRSLGRIRYVLASGRELDVPLATPACAVERPALSRALGDAVEREHGITRIARRVRVERQGALFALASGDERWSARSLIAADGLGGDGAAWLRRASRRRERYGVRARAAERAPLDAVEVHLGRESEVYLTPLAGGRINVAVLRDGLPQGERSARALLSRALAEHPAAARCLGPWSTDPEARVLSRPGPGRVARRGAFLAGDAAGSVDPVLGCGVALALATGIGAARAASAFLADGSEASARAYARLVRRETHLRRRVANGLVFLSRHPRLQDGLALLLGAFPRLTRGLSARVAGG